MATKSKSSAAATRARRAKLAEKPVEYLQNIAADLDIPGRSGMNKQALVKAIDLAQSGKAPKRKPTQKARQKAAAAKKREASVGHGRGPFRLVIAKDDAIYGNLGPYASARAALSDAKTLLRRMAPVKGYALSNTEAQSFVGQSYAGGTIVDGYVVQSKGGTDLNAAAFAVKVGKTSKAAYAADKIPPKLRNNGRRNARGSAADPVAVRELVLSTENDGDVYRQVTTPAIANLARKLAKGQFDRAKAVKMMGYVADAGARKYGWEHVGPRRGSWMGYSLTKAPFTAADRRAAAADLLDAYMEQIESEAASMGGSRRNATPSWRGASAAYDKAQKILEVWNRKEAAAQKRAHTKQGRAASTFRYRPTDEINAFIDALGKGDEEEIKAFNLLHGHMLTKKRNPSKRRNPRVSFQTKDGPVSFMAKKKRNAGKKPAIKPGMRSTLHRDGTVSYWDIYLSQWDRRSADEIPDHVLASMGSVERDRVLRAARRR